jgi:hypothetical protein
MNLRTAQKEVACTPFPSGASAPVKNEAGIYSMAPRTNLVGLVALADCDELGVAAGDTVYVAREQANSAWGRNVLTLDVDIDKFIMVPADQVRFIKTQGRG